MTRKEFLKDELTGGGVGLAYFRFLNSPKLEEALKLKLANGDETQNDSPTISQFLELMKAFGMNAHGYIVDEERSDARISLEGVEGFVSYEDLQPVHEALGGADEFTLSHVQGGYYVYSWWD